MEKHVKNKKYGTIKHWLLLTYDDMLFSTIVLSKEIHNDERCIVACSFCNDRLGQQIHIFDGMNDELIKSRVLHKKESSKMITSFDVFLISCSSTGNIVIVDARTGGINKKLNFSDFEVAAPATSNAWPHSPKSLRCCKI